MRKRKDDPDDQAVISIIAEGARVTGEVTVKGTIRVEGEVDGNVTAGKAVVVGKEGAVRGDIVTEDAVLSGVVEGTIRAASRLELHATSRIDGQVRARRMKLEEGALLNGTVLLGEEALEETSAAPEVSDSAAAEERAGAVPVDVESPLESPASIEE